MSDASNCPGQRTTQRSGKFPVIPVNPSTPISTTHTHSYDVVVSQTNPPLPRSRVHESNPTPLHSHNSAISTRLWAYAPSTPLLERTSKQTNKSQSTHQQSQWRGLTPLTSNPNLVFNRPQPRSSTATRLPCARIYHHTSAIHHSYSVPRPLSLVPIHHPALLLHERTPPPSNFTQHCPARSTAQMRPSTRPSTEDNTQNTALHPPSTPLFHSPFENLRRRIPSTPSLCNIPF